ncbi:unnamed protein product [Musa acuminata var. zebrina]
MNELVAVPNYLIPDITIYRPSFQKIECRSKQGLSCFKHIEPLLSITTQPKPQGFNGRVLSPVFEGNPLPQKAPRRSKSKRIFTPCHCFTWFSSIVCCISYGFSSDL